MTLSTYSKLSSTGATQSSNKMSIRAWGRNRRRAYSEGVVRTVSPSERSRTIRSRWILLQSQRDGPNGCGLSSHCRPCIATARIRGEDSTISRRLFIFALLLVFYCGFVNQHDGNVVTNGIDSMTL